MYQGQCIGRLIFFLEEYCGISCAHEFTFHPDQTVYYGEQMVARYAWNDDFPAFDFYGPHAADYERNQEERYEEVVRRIRFHEELLQNKPTTRWLAGSLKDYVQKHHSIKWMGFKAVPLGTAFILEDEPGVYTLCCKINEHEAVILTRQGCPEQTTCWKPPANEPLTPEIQPDTRCILVDRICASIGHQGIHDKGIWFTDPQVRTYR